MLELLGSRLGHEQLSGVERLSVWGLWNCPNHMGLADATGRTMQRKDTTC